MLKAKINEEFMLKAKINEEFIIACDLNRGDRELNKLNVLTCPVCNESTILKYGEIKIPHFAHKVKGDCTHGEGMSEEHLNIQTAFYQQLKNIFDIDIEVPIGNRKADIAITHPNGNKVIEIQLSRITLEEVKSREKDYWENGYVVIWVFGDYFRRLKNSVILDHEWGLHGRLYFWKGCYLILRQDKQFTSYYNISTMIKKELE